MPKWTAFGVTLAKQQEMFWGRYINLPFKFYVSISSLIWMHALCIGSQPILLAHHMCLFRASSPHTILCEDRMLLYITSFFFFESIENDVWCGWMKEQVKSRIVYCVFSRHHRGADGAAGSPRVVMMSSCVWFFFASMGSGIFFAIYGQSSSYYYYLFVCNYFSQGDSFLYNRVFLRQIYRKIFDVT